MILNIPHSIKFIEVILFEYYDSHVQIATELEEPLKEIHHEHKDLIFIVPSKEDKNLLLETLSIEGLAHDFPAIWRWGDLYGGLADILRRLGIRPPIKRQIRPSRSLASRKTPRSKHPENVKGLNGRDSRNKATRIHRNNRKTTS